MSVQLPRAERPVERVVEPLARPSRTVVSHRQFVAGVFAVLGLTIATFAVILGALDRVGRLPPPPLAGNVCVNEKFKFLAGRDIGGTDLIAVGSSVTWRNLDMAAFERNRLAARPLNAATCYLQLGQVSYYTEFLLSRLERIRTVVTVVAPRDFEQCSGTREKFFSTDLADAWVFAGMTPFPIYLANFRPGSFARDVIRIKKLRTEVASEHSMVMDGYGTSPLQRVGDWWPPPVLTASCFAALAELERIVNRRGAALIVATLPLHPEWTARFDPQGTLFAAFEARLRGSLASRSTLFVNAAATHDPAWRYADSVHLLHDSASAFSDQLAGIVAARRD
jgi:hypothetical protein